MQPARPVQHRISPCAIYIQVLRNRLNMRPSESQRKRSSRRKGSLGIVSIPCDMNLHQHAFVRMCCAYISIYHYRWIYLLPTCTYIYLHLTYIYLHLTYILPASPPATPPTSPPTSPPPSIYIYIRRTYWGLALWNTEFTGLRNSKCCLRKMTPLCVSCPQWRCPHHGLSKEKRVHPN